MVYICVKNTKSTRRFSAEEHWNWPKGTIIDVFCCSNCPEVKLELNGRVIKTAKMSQAREGWLKFSMPWRSGTLKAVGGKDGKELCTFSLKTAGPAARVTPVPEKLRLKADGKDICHIPFYITDKAGVRVPTAQNEVTFTLTGPARLLGMENGQSDGNINYQDNKHEVRKGRALAIIQSTRKAGNVTIKATAPNLKSATVTLKTGK